MKQFVVAGIAALFSRRALWRLGRSMYLWARADVPRAMGFNGEERMQHELLRACTKLGQAPVIFDVGANVGNWTLRLLDECTELKPNWHPNVHCFEPVPATFETLQSRVSAHALSRDVYLVPLAFSAEQGTAEMFIAGETAGTNSLHDDAMRVIDHRIQVDLTTVSEYCRKKSIKSIHYLKCDTEGHDIEVLRGASAMFRDEKIMAFQFEYNYKWVTSRHYLLDVFEFAASIPYIIGKITPEGVELFENWHPELERFFDGNYVLIHKDVVCWFTRRSGTFDEANTFVAGALRAPDVEDRAR